MTDIVHEIIARAKQRIAEAYGLPDEVADLLGMVEAEVKREFGGDELYIRKPERDDARTREAVRRDYLANQPIESITARHGVSRATLYRYIKR